MIRYTITAIKKDGLRHLAFNNNGRNTFEKKDDAEQKLKDVIANNSTETVKEHVGRSLRVDPVECYPGGDATRTVF